MCQNVKLGHLNVNSLRHKFDHLAEAMRNGIFDILMLQGTKLDDSFPDSQFATEGFKMSRKDIKSDTGGLMMYVRSDFPQKRRAEIEHDDKNSDGRIRTLAVEVVLNEEKWLICWFKHNLFSEVSKHQSNTQMATSYNPEQFSTRKEGLYVIFINNQR